MSGKFQIALLWGAGIAALALLSCSGSTMLSTANYNFSCTSAADCAPVFFGDVCGCTCANAAVNKSELTRYQADYTNAHGGCIGPACAADWVNATAVCTTGGLCALAQ